MVCLLLHNCGNRTSVAEATYLKAQSIYCLVLCREVSRPLFYFNLDLHPHAPEPFHLTVLSVHMSRTTSLLTKLSSLSFCVEKGPEFDPQPRHVRKSDMVGMPIIPALGRQRQQLPGTLWSAGQPSLLGELQTNKSPCPNTKMDGSRRHISGGL